MSANYAQLAHALRPELSLVLGALLVIAGDLTAGRGRSLAQRLHTALAFGAIAIVAALAQSFLVGAAGGVFGNVLALGSLAVATRAGILALALLTLGIAAGAAPVRNPAEYVAIILFATTGLLLMAAVWENWQGADGSDVDTVAILTRPADGPPASRDEQVPVLLRPQAIDTWLDPFQENAGRALALLRPLYDPPISQHPVHPKVANTDLDDASLIVPKRG